MFDLSSLINQVAGYASAYNGISSLSSQNSTSLSSLASQYSASGQSSNLSSLSYDYSSFLNSSTYQNYASMLSANGQSVNYNAYSSLLGTSSTNNYTVSPNALSVESTGTVGGFSSNISTDEIANFSTILSYTPTTNADGGSVWGALGYGQQSEITYSGNFSGYVGSGEENPSMNYTVPIYEDKYEQVAVYNYVEYQAWDYDFQLGQKTHGEEVTSVNKDPVIFDLDGDGELGVTGKDSSTQTVNETTTEETVGSTTTTTKEWDTLVDWNNKIDYDVDGDGNVDRTEWLKSGSGDGLMVFDQDGDGSINGRELMNETGIDGEQNKYANGWEKARDLFDKDGDGILKGEELTNVKIWQDANGDGVTDEGELVSMEDLGITQIDTNKGSFTRQELAGYETQHTREQVGYTEHFCYTGMNTYGVGYQTYNMNGEVVDSYVLGG